ncbi:poliovirus receptor isoform X2 [Rhinolophus ferrumequinum]|uniref:poliovirus receptor isoform X2 n=1 Tax=Rhinolophus ferrumequinum TaxID=59479 RepID=UPI00140F7340|nr:poliovirus receptor isoform X2 [Rhinolophus ferrumequinum]
MTRAASTAWPPLLSLLSLCWTSTVAETETIVVQAPPHVRGFLGDNATLQCKLHTQEKNVQVTLVTWMRQDLAGRPRSVAVFHPIRGPSFPSHPSFPEPGRLEFVAARPGVELRDATLAVRGLRAEDEANYTCHFATFPHGSRSASTWLHVLVQPQNKADNLEVPLSLLSQEPVPVALCISTGGRPPANISWSLDGKANTSQVPGPLPGTFTVTSFLILTPSSQINLKNVTCIVKHESFEEPILLPVTLRVHYPPEVSISGYDDNWYLGQSEATLSCDVRSNPEPTDYEWSTTTGSLPSSAVPKGNQLQICPVDELINTTFTCSVTNAVGTGRAELPILLREGPSREQSHPALSPALVALIVVVVLIAVLSVVVIYRRCFRQSQSLLLSCER